MWPFLIGWAVNPTTDLKHLNKEAEVGVLPGREKFFLCGIWVAVCESTLFRASLLPFKRGFLYLFVREWMNGLISLPLTQAEGGAQPSLMTLLYVLTLKKQTFSVTLMLFCLVPCTSRVCPSLPLMRTIKIISKLVFLKTSWFPGFSL